MAPKSSVQTIVMVHLSSKYGQNVVEKKLFWPKTGKINFFFVFPNSTHEDGFRELSYALLAQKKTWFVADLSNIFLLIMTWPCFDHKFPKIILKNIFFWFIWIRLMRTVSGSFHGPKKLGPNDSYGQFIVKILVPEKKIVWKLFEKLVWAELFGAMRAP